MTRPVRSLKFSEALREGLDLCLEKDPRVYVMGLGVPDPKGVFGTTLGLVEKYGADRVMDMPTSENGMTGIAIGSALVGMRPVMVHQRLDFALLAMDQIVNIAAKWNYMYGGKTPVPLVIRLIVGRGWGQGPQHSQSLQSWFTHIPGLKVVMPVTPADAKGLLISAIEDNNPVIFIEHRWLHNTFGPVEEGHSKTPIGKARVARNGKDLTLVATSFMVVESLRAAVILEKAGIDVEVIDVRTLRPLDLPAIQCSVTKTGRLLAVDTGWSSCGFAGEILAAVSESRFHDLKTAPRRITLADTPVPTSPELSKVVYPRTGEIVGVVCEMLGRPPIKISGSNEKPTVPLDIPDPSFAGPF